MSRMWKGYSDEALSCEYLLKKAMGLLVLAARGSVLRRAGSVGWMAVA